MNPQNDCALCQFFYSIREPYETEADPVYGLRVWGGKILLGVWKLPFCDSLFFSVVSEKDELYLSKTLSDMHSITIDLLRLKKASAVVGYNLNSIRP